MLLDAIGSALIIFGVLIVVIIWTMAFLFRLWSRTAKNLMARGYEKVKAEDVARLMTAIAAAFLLIAYGLVVKVLA